MLLNAARTFAIGMVFVMFAIFAIAVVAGEAKAHGGHNPIGWGCAKMLNNPTDGNCEFYALSRHRYFHWSNDRYANLYYYHKRTGHNQKAWVELQAARFTCKGTLYEDFSCSGPKR